MKFEINQQGMRDLERQVKQDATRHYQQMFDRLSRQHRGKPVDEVKRALGRAWAADGGTITDPELTDWATAISEGTHIRFK